MTGGREVYITWGGNTVHLRGHSPDETGLFVSGDGIEGWDAPPDAKVSLTEMQTGNGAFGITADEVLYSARTVSVNFHAHGTDRAETVSLMRDLGRACGNVVELRVVDADEDTFCTGYVQPDFESEWYKDWATGTLTVVCPDPRRLATSADVAALVPGSGASGGLVFDGHGCMEWPVTFGGEFNGANVATLHNGGTANAYPIINASGSFPDGLRIVCSTGGEITYPEALSWQPLKLNSLTRTASINGVDVTRRLTSRDFPVVPPGGSVTVALFANGNGSVEVEVRDTYI